MTATWGLRRAGWATALLFICVAALAAASSPGRRHLSNPATWLLAFTLLLALPTLAWAAVTLLQRHDGVKPTKSRTPFDVQGLLTVLVMLLVIAGLVWALHNALPGGAGATAPQIPVHSAGAPLPPPISTSSAHGLHLGPWLVVLGGLLILAMLVYVLITRVRSARAPVEEPEFVAGDPLVAAIEAALIDLDGETDPRRAVIKAYARTEAVLRAHGLPRPPADTPLEYLDRVLREMGGQAGAVDRLTELFERAAFSTHEVGSGMRDEAVAAFVALRDGIAGVGQEVR